MSHSPSSSEAATCSNAVGADGIPTKDGGAGCRQSSAFKSYLRVFSYNDTIGWCLNAVAFVCMVAAGVLMPLMDVFFGRFVTVFNNYLVGSISPEHYRSEVNRYTLYFVYLFVGKFVLVYAWTVLVSTNAIRTTRSLRLSFLSHTLRQEVAFFDSSEAGSVSGYVTTNGNLVNSGISEKLGLAVQAISTFVTAFIVAFAVQWKLTLICICVVPTILLVTCVCMVIDTAQENHIMAIQARAGHLAEEAFASVRTVHAFWAYPKLARRFEDILDEAGEVGKKKSPNYAVLFSIEFFSIFAGYGLAFWQGVRMYHSGEIGQPGQVITVIFAVLLAAQALTQIAPQTVIISKAAAAADELFHTIDRPSQIDSLSDSGLAPDSCRGEIQFSDISFCYPSRPGVQVLNNLSLNIAANKTTAIVGPSGCGKSTLVGLIERWFTPSSGTVTLDRIPLADYNLRWLRTNVRLVQQEPTLFSGSVFDNVANGLASTSLNDVSRDEKMRLVQEACKAAYARFRVPAAAGVRHADRRARGPALGRSEAAHRDRAGGGVQSEGVAARRGHQRARPGGREDCAEGAGSRRRWPDCGCYRAPLGYRQECGPDCRH